MAGKIYTRADYKAGRIDYHGYLRQFITDELINYVVRTIGANRLFTAYVWHGDPRFNEIPLDEWDRLYPKVRALAANRMKREAHEPWATTIATCICLAKEAARMYCETLMEAEKEEN